ncbi:MAG: GNAT family N-acetyltransferase [Spirochaetales bacterium]
MSRQIYRVTPADLVGSAWRSLVADSGQTHYWSHDWSPAWYRKLALAGFISTAVEYSDPPFLLLPELQTDYAVLDWANLVVDRGSKKFLSGPVDECPRLTTSTRLEPLLDAIAAYHQRSWLCPEYRRVLLQLAADPQPEFQVLSVELRSAEGQLVAGEVGYVAGATYTSLTGFFDRADRRWNNAGKFQLVLWAQHLRDAGYAFWNLGHPYMKYKLDLGAKVLPRQAFLVRWEDAIGRQPLKA